MTASIRDIDDSASARGVHPPFVAPPREGAGKRLGIGLGIGAAVFLLCCGGGFAALVGTTHAVENQRVSDARKVVTKYMNDWQALNYAAAYQLLCSDLKDRTVPTDFANTLGADTVTGFTVNEVSSEPSYARVEVDATFLGGDSRSLAMDVTVDTDGSSKICSM